MWLRCKLPKLLCNYLIKCIDEGTPPPPAPQPKTLNPKENLLKNLTYSSALLLTSWRLHRKQILGDRTAGRRTKRRADGRMSRDLANERAHDARRSGTDGSSSVHGRRWGRGLKVVGWQGGHRFRGGNHLGRRLKGSGFWGSTVTFLSLLFNSCHVYFGHLVSNLIK